MRATGISHLILPSQACYRLGHKIEQRLKQPGPGVYDFCIVCSLGYEMAINRGLDDDAADRFVQDIRRG